MKQFIPVPDDILANLKPLQFWTCMGKPTKGWTIQDDRFTVPFEVKYKVSCTLPVVYDEMLIYTFTMTRTNQLECKMHALWSCPRRTHVEVIYLSSATTFLVQVVHQRYYWIVHLKHLAQHIPLFQIQQSLDFLQMQEAQITTCYLLQWPKKPNQILGLGSMT